MYGERKGAAGQKDKGGRRVGMVGRMKGHGKKWSWREGAGVEETKTREQRLAREVVNHDFTHASLVASRLPASAEQDFRNMKPKGFSLKHERAGAVSTTSVLLPRSFPLFPPPLPHPAPAILPFLLESTVVAHANTSRKH